MTVLPLLLEQGWEVEKAGVVGLGRGTWMWDMNVGERGI